VLLSQGACDRLNVIVMFLALKLTISAFTKRKTAVTARIIGQLKLL